MDKNTFMQRALDLAQNGRYTARPNPCVGCVFVDPISNKIVAEGFHKKCGEDHAEIVALKNLAKINNKIFKGVAKGLDCYITLEPCSHHGKTPPCVNALIDSEVGRVFIACKDPNPLVSGKGILKLEKAGIKVEIGLLEDKSKKLNAGFLYAMENKRPYIRCKVATSLDGKIALKNGLSKWITGEQARENGQYLRARSGAVITGVGTINTDNSLMNVRPDDWKFNDLSENYKTLIKQPLRIVIDPRVEIDLNSKWLKSDGEKWIIINKNLNKNTDISEKIKKLSKYNDLVIKNIIDNKNLSALFDELYQNNIYDILVEAGPRLTGYFIDNNLINELWHYQAPCIIGGDGKDFAVIKENRDMQDVLRFGSCDMEILGGDLLRVFYLS